MSRLDLPWDIAAVRRAGLIVGLGALATGLALSLAAHLRPSGLGVAPALAHSPVHLQAQIQVFAGCVALIVTLLWSALSRSGILVGRTAPLVVGTIALSALAVLTRLLLNWAMVTGHLADHWSLIPAVGDLALAALFLSAVFPLSGATDVGLSGRLLLRSSSWWLLASAVGQFTAILARVLGTGSGLNHLERPSLEVALLGFVMLGGLGVMLATLPLVSLNRNLIQTLLRTHQAANGLIAAWGLLQGWSIRYPGGYHSLLLALVGTGILASVIVIAANSGLLARWQAETALTEAEGGRRSELIPASAAIGLMVLGAVIFAITGLLAALNVPNQETVAAELMVFAVGMATVVSVAVMTWVCGWSGWSATAGTAATAFGAATASLLWILSLAVERSLDPIIGAAEVVACAGMLALALVTVGPCTRGRARDAEA
ncbi:MAG: hypothetical protein AB7Y46_20330 [Armatimonadota bacterium]